jgi:hypothetical protein
VGYDDDKGLLLARTYFPQTGVFELHDNSNICYQNLNEEVESKAGDNLANATIVRDPEEYKYLIGTRHVDPDSGCTYETTEIKVTPNKNIVAWRKKFYNGKLDKNSQGPFFAEDIHQYNHQTLSTGLSKRGKHNNNKKTTCDVPADNKSKLSNAQDEMFGSISLAGDVHTIDKIVPSQHRSTNTPIGNLTDTSISNNNIITNNINKFSTRKRA